MLKLKTTVTLVFQLSVGHVTAEHRRPTFEALSPAIFISNDANLH